MPEKPRNLTFDEYLKLNRAISTLQIRWRYLSSKNVFVKKKSMNKKSSIIIPQKSFTSHIFKPLSEPINTMSTFIKKKIEDLGPRRFDVIKLFFIANLLLIFYIINKLI